MKVKEWIKEHKEEIAMTGLAVGGVIFGYWFCKTHTKPVFIDKGVDCGTIPSKPYQKIDEDIFAILAPMIEDAVLTEGVDESLFDTTYTVPFPKNGDWKNGTYEILKNVQVIVKDVGDAVKEAVEEAK